MIINEEQGAELELMEAAYGEDFRKLESHNNYVRYCVKLHAGHDSNTTATVTISLASDFPITPIHCAVDGILPALILHELNKIVHTKVSEDSNLGSMDVCQCVVDYLNGWDESERNKKASNIANNGPTEITIARFLIYFHHIMSSTKRKAIVDNALELKLGGISKTGFPGVVIIEGLLENVLEYVRRIQRLRWQQMVVRGEETEIIDPNALEQNTNTNISGGSNIDDIINTYRKIQTCFYELPTTTEGNMSAVGVFCKDCHIHALFMTAMKKYDTNT